MVRVFPISMLSPYIPAKTSVKGTDSGVSVISVVKRLIKFRLRNEIGKYRVVKRRRCPRRPMLIFSLGCATPLDGILYCE
jgi:hypothetical protein